jgi:hypothetical protein
MFTLWTNKLNTRVWSPMGEHPDIICVHDANDRIIGYFQEDCFRVSFDRITINSYYFK